MVLNDNIYVKVRQTICAVRLESILYMEKRSRRIIIHVDGGDDICFYGKIDSVTPFLDGRFVHPHQSYVINMQHIFRLGQQEAVMFGGDRIEMGNRCFGKLRRAYSEFISGNVQIRPDM